MSAPTTTYYDLVKPEYTDPSDVKDLNDNFDKIDEALHGLADEKLGPVTPTSDPTASGTTIDFIATLSQAADGKITLTKKSVRGMTGANGSTAGTSGLVPAPAASDNTKFLRGDATWAVPTNTDTKNTAGSTNKASTKMFLVAAASQADNPQTYSNSNCYIGTDNCLYSGGTKVLTAHQDISGKKNTQTAVTDPTASGTSITFIATLSQNTQGVVSVTKKTVSTFGGASASGNGSAGLVPAPGAGNQSKFLRGDGTWQVPTNTDTKNTAGSTNTTSKIFLIGATSQGDNPQTYSNSSCYASGGKLYSNGAEVLTGHQSLASCLKTTGNQSASGVQSFTNTTESSGTGSGAVVISGGLGVAKKIYGNTVWNAVWNDYAECREANTTEPGRCLRETGIGVMVKTHKRMMRGCKIVSDTFGTCMGETEKAKTPIGVAGRVLAYTSPLRPKWRFHIGDPVCSAPDGTIDIMRWWEVILHPDCIVGYVSELPQYEKWIAGTKEDPKEINVDGRIWIYVR